MALGISTGCCYDLGLSRIESLRFLKRFDIDAVELLFAFPEDLFSFKLTREDIAFLRSKKYVSLHAPFFQGDSSHEYKYSGNSESRDIISALNSLALKTGAGNVVFHPECIYDFSLFEKVDFTPLVENMNYKKGAGAGRLLSPEQIQHFLSGHENFGFCFDVGHAMADGINPSDFLVFRRRIKEAHVHFPRPKKGEIRPHGLALKTEKKFLELAKPVFCSGIPLIVESDFLPQDVELLPQEIGLLKSLIAK